jgi:hypothetical protein
MTKENRIRAFYRLSMHLEARMMRKKRRRPNRKLSSSLRLRRLGSTRKIKAKKVAFLQTSIPKIVTLIWDRFQHGKKEELNLIKKSLPRSLVGNVLNFIH